jgi:predicted phage tail protein
VFVRNRERRKEAGKVILDLSKYLATLVIVGAFFTKEPIQWISVIVAGAIAMLLFFVGVTTIAPDKEDK